MNEPADPEWLAAIEKPATRAELLSVMEFLQVTTLSQAIFGGMMIEGDDEQRRATLIDNLELVEKLGARMKGMIASWRADHG